MGGPQLGVAVKEAPRPYAASSHHSASERTPTVAPS
jgi:hypothetical protein